MAGPRTRRALPLCLALVGCHRPQPTPRAAPVDAIAHSPVDAAVDAPEEASAAALEADVPAPSSPLAAVIAAVRRRAWSEAHTALNALSPEVLATREGRYLQARVRIERGDYAGALTPLHGLDALLPVLRVDVLRLEARCLGRVGRHAEARALYERLAREGGGDRDRAFAVLEAWEAGDHAAAAPIMRSWAEHPPPSLDRTRAWQAAAHCLETAYDNSHAAVAAWRALAVQEPDTAAGAEALQALQRLGAPLNTAQSLERAANLIERARHAEAIAALEPIPPDRGAVEARRLHLLGRAYFGARNRYEDAHRLLAQAALRPDNAHRSEDAFLAARALSRADQDDNAVRRYDEVARTERGRWGDEAAYRAAWLEVHHRRTDNAVARLRAFLRDRPEASQRLRVEASWQLGWTLFTAGRFADAVSPLEQSSALATHHLERGRGRYWAALARARQGDAAGAESGWRGLIAHRPLTWYALLSEARLRERNLAVPALAPPPEARPCPTATLPAKVRWLAALGFDDDAATAFDALDARVRASLPADRADEALARAWLSLGAARRAFLLSARHADALDDLPTAETRWVWDMGFPRPHAESVEAAEDASSLPRHYLFAIMRQESGFNPRDVSTARAIGLLQMIPPTTRRVAQTLGIPFREEMLFDPAYNIRVGGWYIGRLFAQYQSVLPRAIGAYNAGPGAMGRWVREMGSDPLDVFVERIPFDETRTYVRRVVQNLARYRYLYGPREGDTVLALPLAGDAPVTPLVDY